MEFGTDKKELNHWQQFDIETNPDLWEISLEEVKEINIKVKQKVEQIFRDSHNQKDAEEESLLNMSTKSYHNFKLR